MSVGAVTPDQIWQIVKQSFEKDTTKIDDKKQKVTGLEDQKTAYDHIDNVLEQLRSVMSSFTKTSSFLQRTVSSSDTTRVTATATSTAPETSFTFDSISQLATAARITSSSLGFTSGTSPYAYSSGDINGGTEYNPNLNITNLQDAAEITAGTLEINGVQVTIDNNDTLNTILTKINNSGAGVIAVFDAANDSVRISGTIAGADEELTFDDGNTNFFTAMNISSYTAGTDNEWIEPLADSALGGSISTGYFTINNFTFYVDPSTESLSQVMRKVNSSNAGVTMFFDEATNKVILQNKQEGKSLLLANDSSGFLDALGLMNQGNDLDGSTDYSEYKGQKAQFVLNGEATERDTNNFTVQGVSFTLLGTSSESTAVTIAKDRDKTLSVAKDFATQFNATIATLDQELDTKDGPLENDYTLRQIKLELLNNVLGQISNPGQYTSLVDIGFELKKADGGGYTLSIDEEKFRDALDQDELSLQDLFAYDSNGNGLLTDGGYAIDTRSYLDTFTRTVSGFFYKQKDNIDDRIDDLNLVIDNLENSLTKKEERKFNEVVQQVTELQRLQAQQSRLQQVSAATSSLLG